MNSYEKQTQKILAGGLSLFAPGDQPQEATDCLILDNFRVNQDGSIKSRYGRTDALATAPTPITSIIKAETVGPTWIYGANGTVTNLGGGQSATGFGTESPIAMVAMNNYLWASSQSKQAKFNGDQWMSWVPDPPTGVTVTESSPGSLIEGKQYTWFVTYVTADGHESGGFEVSQTISTGMGIVTLHIPNSSDPSVVGANVYRMGNTVPTPLKVNVFGPVVGSIDDGGADEKDDLHLLYRDIRYVPGVGAPPPAAGLAWPYFGRMLAFRSAAHVNRLWWSATFKPWAFTDAAKDDGDWVDVGADGEELYAVGLYPRMAILYKANSIWRLIGDPGDPSSTIECIVEGIGIVGPQARARAGRVDYIHTNDGVYAFNGDAATKTTRKLEPLFTGHYPEITLLPAYGANFLKPIDQTKRRNTAMGYRNGLVYVSYTEDQADSNTRTLVYDILRKEWASDSRAFSAYWDEGQNGSLLAADTHLYGIDGSNDDYGQAVPLTYQSHCFDQGAPENQKRYADLVVDIDTADQDLTLQLIYDNGKSSESLGTVHHNGRAQETFKIGPDGLGTLAYNVSIKITGDAHVPVTIYGLHLHYYVEPRSSRTFDTNISDWGTQLTKDVDQIEFDIDAPSPVTLSVFTDLPGGVVALRDLSNSGGTVAVTQGSASVVGTGTAFTAAINGQQFRASGAPDVYTLTFVDATHATLDRPWTGATAANAAYAVTRAIQTSGRQKIEIPINPAVSGRLIRVALSSAAPFRLWAARARFRPIGVYFDGANGELYKTQEIGIGIG